MTQQPAPAQTDQTANWNLLRMILTGDRDRARAQSRNIGDYADNRAYSLTLALDTMDTLEFGLEYVREKIHADWTQGIPGLAEHTEAACDTITRAVTHKPWCGASDYPAVVPTSADAICCDKDMRNAQNRPAACVS